MSHSYTEIDFKNPPKHIRARMGTSVPAVDDDDPEEFARALRSYDHDDLSNLDFLEAVFKRVVNPVVWVTTFPECPKTAGRKWAGRRWRGQEIPAKGENSYFCVAALAEDATARKSEYFRTLPVIVIDDPAPELRERLKKAAAWMLQTSPNKYQMGFILEEPITDLAEAKRWTVALHKAGLTGANDASGNNAVRWVRLPVGSNTKSELGEPFAHCLEVWEPDKTHDAATLWVTLGLQENVDSRASSKEFDPKANDALMGKGPFSITRNKAAILSALEQLDPDSEEHWRWPLKCLKGARQLPEATPEEREWFQEAVFDWARRSAKFQSVEQQEEKIAKQDPAHPRELFNKAKLAAEAAGREWHNPGESGSKTIERREVVHRAGELHRTVADIHEAWGQSGEIYRLGRSLYALATRATGETAPTRLITPDIGGVLVSRHVRLLKPKGDDRVPMDASAPLVKALLGDLEGDTLPRLVGIANQPFLRADGSFCGKPGFDAASGLYAAFEETFDLADTPDEAEAKAALERILSLFEETPAATADDRAALASACLTAAVRRTLRAAPGFLHSGNLQGSGAGKNYAEAMIELFGSANPPAPITFKFERAELDKSLLAALMSFPDAVRFDELQTCSSLAGSPLLLNMLSEPHVTDRILGQSQMVTVPTAVLVQFSGNGIRIEGDMRRRLIEVCYAPSDGHQFTGDPRQQLSQRRLDYVRDALSIVRWGIKTLTPKGAPLAGFGQWDRWVRQPLLALGLADPASSLIEGASTTDGGNVDLDSAGAVLQILQEKHRGGWFTAGDVATAARTDHTLNRQVEKLGNMLLAVRNGATFNPNDSTGVGKLLAILKNLDIQGLRLERKAQSANTKVARRWRIRSTGK